jgi:16S rRNA (uracil1498-N3)-methyltransferase
VEPSPQPQITIAFALVKGQRPDLVVQKLTELGVDRIVPFVAERSVVRWDAPKVERNVQRFARIAREAGMQSRRSRLPAIGLPDDSAHTARVDRGLPGLAEVVGLPGAAIADVAGDLVGPPVSTVVVGPEGGWSEAERALRAPRIRLGPHVMRAETAAITAGALLAASRSDITLSSTASLVAAQEQDVIV